MAGTSPAMTVMQRAWPPNPSPAVVFLIRMGAGSAMTVGERPRHGGPGMAERAGARPRTGHNHERPALIRSRLSGLRLGAGAFGDAGGLAAAATQVIQLGAAHVAAADHRDLGDRRGIQREDALHALAVADLAHGEVAVQALVRAGNAHALERLGTG